MVMSSWILFSFPFLPHASFFETNEKKKTLRLILSRKNSSRGMNWKLFVVINQWIRYINGNYNNRQKKLAYNQRKATAAIKTMKAGHSRYEITSFYRTRLILIRWICLQWCTIQIKQQLSIPLFDRSIETLSENNPQTLKNKSFAFHS